MKISFIPSSIETEIVVPEPQPAKKYTPSWFKEIKRPKKIEVDDNGMVTNNNAKMCMPFTDSFINGYIQETWTDIYIEEKEEGELRIVASIGPEIFSVRESDHSIKIPEEYYPLEFVWIEQWIPKTPKGYSCLVTHPLNHDDLPFRSLSAVIDTDKYYHEYNGRHPFLLKRGFTGIIPVGTPMFQIVPIKRESWSSSKNKFSELENKKNRSVLRRHFVDGYKNLFWQKKVFS